MYYLLRFVKQKKSPSHSGVAAPPGWPSHMWHHPAFPRSLNQVVLWSTTTLNLGSSEISWRCPAAREKQVSIISLSEAEWDSFSELGLSLGVIGFPLIGLRRHYAYRYALQQTAVTVAPKSEFSQFWTKVYFRGWPTSQRGNPPAVINGYSWKSERCKVVELLTMIRCEVGFEPAVL